MKIREKCTCECHRNPNIIHFMPCCGKDGYIEREIDDINEREDKVDKVVEDVIKQLRKRSSIGIKKYGTTLEENNKDNFLQHLKEELMDGILYIEKLQSLGYDDILDKIMKDDARGKIG